MAQNLNLQQISCGNTSDDFVVNASNSNKLSIFNRITKPNIAIVAEDSAASTRKLKDKSALLNFEQASKSFIRPISKEDGSMDSPVKITSAQSDGALQLEQGAVKEKTTACVGIPTTPTPSGLPALCNEINTQRKFQIRTYLERDICETTSQPNGWAMAKLSEEDKCQITYLTTGWAMGKLSEKDKCQITPETIRKTEEKPSEKDKYEIISQTTGWAMKKTSEKYNCQMTKPTRRNRKKASQQDVNITPVSTSKNKFYQCRLCEHTSTKSVDRRKHEAEMHQFYSKQIMKCPECSDPLKTYRELIIHLQKVHTRIDFRTETLFFVGPEDFQNWKVAIEKETVSEYVLVHCVERKNYIQQTFTCRPNGLLETYAEKDLEIWEGNQTDSVCPANMYVITRVTNDFYMNVEVTHLKTHVGHECEVQRNSLESNQISQTNQARVYGRVITSIRDYCKLHQKNEHGFDEANKEFKCSECLSVFPLKTKIIEHITKMHSAICMEETTIYFRKFGEFVEWKMDVEKNTGTEYEVHRPHIINYKCLRLDCHLSGIGEPGFFCPAGITVRMGRNSPGTKYTTVAYMFTHLGHEIKQEMKKIVEIDEFELCRTTVLYDHIAAENISREVSITKRNEGEWVVSPCLDDSRAHVVKKVDLDSQHDCNAVKCFQCNICFHQFECTCNSKTNLKKICRHVHITCIMNKRRDEKDIESTILIPNRTGNDPSVNIDTFDGDSLTRGQEQPLISLDIAEDELSVNARGAVSAFSKVKKLNRFESDSDSDPDCLIIDTDPEVSDVE